MTRNHYKHLQMEGYIPSADAAAPGRTSNKTQEQTTPDQPRSRAASGEMPPFGSSLAQHTFDDPDLRRDTFSNEDVIAGQLDNMAGQRDSVSFPNRRFQNVLDMSDPAYSAPGTDFLLAAEYIVGGNTYDAGEVLDANSFPELQQERSLRIADILRNMHQQRNSPQGFVPKTLPTNRPSAGMTRDSFIRQENLRLWKEELFNASFVNTGDPNHPMRVNVKKLTIQDGRVFRKGQSVDPKLVTLHIQSIVQEATRAESAKLVLNNKAVATKDVLGVSIED